jgi:hypothetical protein
MKGSQSTSHAVLRKGAYYIQHTARRIQVQCVQDASNPIVPVTRALQRACASRIRVKIARLRLRKSALKLVEYSVLHSERLGDIALKENNQQEEHHEHQSPSQSTAQKTRVRFLHSKSFHVSGFYNTTRIAHYNLVCCVLYSEMRIFACVFVRILEACHVSCRIACMKCTSQFVQVAKWLSRFFTTEGSVVAS